MRPDADTVIGGQSRGFPQTRPTLIRETGSAGQPGREALSEIAVLYWKPVYKHIRLKWNRLNEEAKDLTQSFFCLLVETDMLAKFDPDKGSFRNYLRSCLDHFVHKNHQTATRLKRGGAAANQMDFETAERELAGLSSPSAEDIFLREWRREVMQQAVGDLAQACASAGKPSAHTLFLQYDLAEGDRPSYADLAKQHNLPVTTVTNRLAWARRELRRLALLRLERLTPHQGALQRESRALFNQGQGKDGCCDG